VTTKMPLKRRVISYLYMTYSYMIARDEIQSVKIKIWLQALRDNEKYRNIKVGVVVDIDCRMIVFVYV
jgi:hypothetical protein